MNRRPIDTLVILGDKDKVLPLNGGKSLFTMLLENSNLSAPREQAPFWGSRMNATEAVTTHAPEYVRRDWFAGQSPTRVTEYVVKDGEHAIDGAHAKKNLIQFFMGAPKPDNYFDARMRTWNFVMRSLRRNLESTEPAIAQAG